MFFVIFLKTPRQHVDAVDVLDRGHLVKKKTVGLQEHFMSELMIE